MIFVSTMCYSLGKLLGYDAAVREVHKQLESPQRHALPCVRAIARLREIDEVQLMIDPAATSIAKARSRAFSAAHASGADTWMMVDDDCEATTDTLDSLRTAARTGQQGLVIAPCLLREQDRVNVALYRTALNRRLADGAVVYRAHCGGLAIAAMGRTGMDVIEQRYRDELVYEDHDGEQRLALFIEVLAGGQWLGEDVAFCARADAAGVVVEALGTGVTQHAGKALLLAEVQNYRGLEDDPGNELQPPPSS